MAGAERARSWCTVVTRALSIVCALSPALAIVFLLLLGFGYYWFFGLGAKSTTIAGLKRPPVLCAKEETRPQEEQGKLSCEMHRGEGSCRTLWVASALALSVTMVWNWFAAVSIILDNLKPLRPIGRWVFISLLFVALGFVVLFVWRWDWTGTMGERLLAVLEDEVHVPIVTATRINNTLAALTVVFVVASCCLLAYGKSDCIDNVARKVAQFRLSLYSAACLFVVGIFEIYNLFQWASSVYSGDDTSAAFLLTNGIAVSWGVFYTACLTAVFLPVAAIQDHWISQLQHPESKEGAHETRRDWLSDNGIPSSPLHAFGNYVAILAPFIMGLLAKTF